MKAEAEKFLGGVFKAMELEVEIKMDYKAEAVSYTHLDVYKRQASHSPTTFKLYTVFPLS